MPALATLLDQYRSVSLTSSRELYPDAGGTGLPLLKVDTSLCQAVISLQGAQLLEFKNAQGTPLLWLSPQCQFEPGTALRGGIPLCLPWFGPHPQDSDKPKHGFARTRDWELVQVAESDDGRCELVFELICDANPLFDHAFSAELCMKLGKGIDPQLSVTNRDQRAFDCTWALHSYFPVRNLEEVRVKGLAGKTYLDNLEQLAPKTQEQDLGFIGEVDRMFPGVEQALEIDGEPTIRIEHDQCPSVITWNPGPEHAAKMADVGAGNEQGFICVERGAVLGEAWHLEAGETRIAGMKIIEA
ncbi:D-hexose-6-phosphate mutarotase [Marinimicrobium sp. ABcell2]|uniref:D-hexose-6-phosphate mutarotase n=1 Tax=Marinimicrobium sp. ABcell2 TaxID=3069751 RepID=UPI0027B7069A|nr:D-hexose-6-phosphate mutarotase [Marinimicrobium sp. ABcell2]MDQ2075494.1 D-hexose-6-phosphate mutarotase [Marinimicrobium sp. ABcell2]